MKMLFCLLGLTIMGQSFADDPYRTAAYLHLAKTYLDLSNIRNAPMDCNRMYELNKSIAENYQSGSSAVVAGTLSQAMSLEDLESNPVVFRKDPILKLLRKNKYDFYSNRSVRLLHQPASSYEREECRDYEVIEHSIINIDDKTCRQVKFARNKTPENTYFMTYCAGDKNVYINYHPQNQFEIYNSNPECQ